MYFQTVKWLSAKFLQMNRDPAEVLEVLGLIYVKEGFLSYN